MPQRGICAHRGASNTHPENTLAAFKEAIRLGAQMIEFDVALTKDGELVLMHDSTLDRTIDGSGPVKEKTLAELRQLDAGSWKGAQFRGERIPTLDEALEIMPLNIWLNVHLKGGAELAEKTARQIIAHDMKHQAFLACGKAAAEAAQRIDPEILICNMERQGNNQQYVDETIAMEADFIQLLRGKSVAAEQTRQLTMNRVRINYCCANEAEKVRMLFQQGVEFPLVDELAAMLEVADDEGIPRLKPIPRQPKNSQQQIEAE